MPAKNANILSITSMAVMLLGITLGYQLIALKKNFQARFSQASTTQTAQTNCSYYALAEVHKDIKGTIFPISEVGTLQIFNNRGQALDLNERGYAQAAYTNQNMVFDPRRRTGYTENDLATVTLKKLDTSVWQVKGVFCDAYAGSTRGCPPDIELARMNARIAQQKDQGFAIYDFRVNCGVHLTYGWIVSRRQGAPPPSATPLPIHTLTPTPTIRPGVPPGSPNSTPIPTSPAVPPANGRGALEVQVVALNYPQKTSLWPPDHNANFKPASCTRQNIAIGEETRPLYLNFVDLTATCVSGACRIGRSSTVRLEKNKGYATFADLEPGQYRVEVKAIDPGYHVWSGCSSSVWSVFANQTAGHGVVILENEKKGSYEQKNSESACRDSKGQPHLIEGITGIVCYFSRGNGGQPTSSPQPNLPGRPNTPQPLPSSPIPICLRQEQQCKDDYYERCSTPDSRQGTKYCHKVGTCAEPGDGTKCRWEAGSYCEACVPDGGPMPTTAPGGGATMVVKVTNLSDKIKDVTVRLRPCPDSGPCEGVINFARNGEAETSFEVSPTDIRYRVAVERVSFFGAAGLDGAGTTGAATAPAKTAMVRADSIDNVRVRANRCGSGYIERYSSDYDMCVTKPPALSQFSVSVKSDPSPDNPPPAPQPPRNTACGYYLNAGARRCFVACGDDPLYRNCSPNSLRPYFGEFGERILAQAAGICWNESRGYVAALNDACFRPTEKCKSGQRIPHCATRDYSAGLFQINQIGRCVEDLGTRDPGPMCRIRSGIDPKACLNQAGLLEFDGNLRAAKDFYQKKKWQAWGYQCGQ